MRNLSLDNYFLELFKMFKFAIVGLIATSIHMLIVWVLVGHIEIPVFSANTIAFISAFAFSFSGHFYWTFSSKNRSSETKYLFLKRFFTVSLILFLLNNAVLVSLIKLTHLSMATLSVISVSVVPIASYLISRFWAFKE